jgi:transcriptional regulator with XRE-family HTH domain
MRDPKTMPSTLGDLIRNARTQQALSIRHLATRTNISPSMLSLIETGHRHPTQATIGALDTALNAGGNITEAWEQADQQRQRNHRTAKTINESVRDSLKMVTTEDEGQWPDLTGHAENLAETYLLRSPAEMLAEAMNARAIMLSRIDLPSANLATARRALAVIQGVLAYAALDLGHPIAAQVHADVAKTMAQRAEDTALTQWVHSTQALIYRYTGDFDAAIDAGEEGLALGAAPGTGKARLWAGLAQSRSRAGDLDGAKSALYEGQRERDKLIAPDELGGLFAFSRAKQETYILAALRISDSPADVQRAVRAAEDARMMWAADDAGIEPVRDERLCRAHQAAALVAAEDLGEVSATLAPLLELPADQRSSWLTRELDDIHDALLAPRWSGSVEAEALRDLIR